MAKKRPELNWFVLPFRARRRFKPSWTAGELLMRRALRRNTRLFKLSDETVRAEGKAAGASLRVVSSFLDWRRVMKPQALTA